jgi:carbonic anhydrase/acetyltransferase-like protein (isoleucine patch superfamily)
VIVAYGACEPLLGEGAWVAESALVLGDVQLGSDTSVWYGSIVRGDVHSIRIGEGTNIQDRCVVHVSTGTHPTQIGDHVTVGHGAIIHGCTVGDLTLVGIGAVILDGAVVEEECVVAAGSLLPPGKRYPSGSLIVGSPALVKRQLDPQERAQIRRSAEQYVSLAHKHAEIVLISQ